MMLRKRVRVTNVAPFLFLGCTRFLLFILLVTPLDITYAQDDTGEIFWGDEEEDEDEFFEEDDDYEEGVASSIAHRMMIESDKKVHTLGLEHRTAGFHKNVDNLPPSPEKIVNKVMEIINV